MQKPLVDDYSFLYNAEYTLELDWITGPGGKNGQTPKVGIL